MATPNAPLTMEAEERKEQQHGQEQEAEQWLEARSLLVLYGTETGHSQEIAEEIGEVAERMRFRTAVEQMNDVSLVSWGRWLFVSLRWS